MNAAWSDIEAHKIQSPSKHHRLLFCVCSVFRLHFCFHFLLTILLVLLLVYPMSPCHATLKASIQVILVVYIFNVFRNPPEMYLYILSHDEEYSLFFLYICNMLFLIHISIQLSIVFWCQWQVSRFHPD